ncbi:alpha/beta fold hydrolase [Streptomyces sp. NPDC001903]|uniref:alpha/beta fold hydrolase n=1 Tax=Streptomyces sp. NPDC001903 TaxID=3364622 RepID=UPI00367F67BC
MFTFDSSDGTTVTVHTWLPGPRPGDGSAGPEPRAIVLIAHGMGEHALRYAPLAGELASRGYAVYAPDHRGHGLTMNAGPGVLGENGWQLLVDDLAALSETVRGLHPGMPLVLLGHSLGSFAAQHYLLDWPEHADAVALYGTTAVDRMFLRVAEAGADPLAAFNAPFEPARTPADWLSRDEAQVDAYLADPLCGFAIDDRAMGELYEAASTRFHDPAGAPPAVPLYVAVGSADPLNYGLELSDLVVERYRAAGHPDVEYRTYEDARHELFNETDRDRVVADLLGWLERVVG